MGRLTAIILGAAAGGGYPQWNCRCVVCRLAWDGDPRVCARTQASLAVSGDGERWTLFNAAPDLRAQLAATGDNPMFNALGSDIVTRNAVPVGAPFVLPGSVAAELFIVPGKVPLY